MKNITTEAVAERRALPAAAWIKDIAYGGGALKLLGSFVFIFSLFFVFDLFARVTLENHENGYMALLVSAAFSVLFANVRYEHFHGLFRTVLCASALSVAAQLILGSATDLPADAVELRRVEDVNLYRYLGFMFCALGLLRPSFLVPGFVSLAQVFYLKVKLYGIYGGITDFYTIAEVGAFTAFFYCLLSFAFSMLPKSGRKLKFEDAAFSLLFVGAIGVHFGNYFYSGVAKIVLDGGVFSWLLDTRPAYLMLAAAEIGNVPLLYFGRPFVDRIAFWMNEYSIAVNLFVLSTQLAAILFFAHRRLTILLCLLYDFFHVFVFLTSGIFFWKWILFNLGLAIAINRFRYIQHGLFTVVPAAFAVVLGNAYFEVAWLGWYTGAASRIERLYATTHDGTRVLVPSNYFLGRSMAVGQARAYRLTSGQLATVSALASALDYEALRRSYSCELQPAPRKPDFSLEKHYARVVRFVRDAHAYHLAFEKSGTDIDYDKYPHHVWSFPPLFSEFKALRSSDIERFEIEILSVCFRWNGNAYEQRVVATDTYSFAAQ